MRLIDADKSAGRYGWVLPPIDGRMADGQSPHIAERHPLATDTTTAGG